MQNKIALAKRILPLIDLTSLNETDNDATIRTLCEQADTAIGKVAAVCVYPRFVKLAKKILLNSAVKVATVSNFPQGKNNLSDVILEINQAIFDGADEIDVVMPYQDYLHGNHDLVKNFIQTCKQNCGPKICLKVILETGVLQQLTIISAASNEVILAGADFIKTSTGKVSVGATLPAARSMLEAIRDNNRKVGFKAAGGIRTIEQAQNYLQLADEIMGTEWVSPQTFRIGASGLLKEIMELI